MPSARFDETQYLVPREELLEHASLAVLRSSFAGLPMVSGWAKGSVRKEPIAISDMNGTPLFWDYPVVRGSEVSGHVRTAASRILGTPVLSLELGPRPWSYEAAVRKLTPKVKKENPRAQVATPRLVCYSYPKLGVLFEVSSPEGSRKLVYDVASLNLVPPEAAKGREGAFAWSFYDSLPDEERQARLGRFSQSDKARTAISTRLRGEIVAARSLQRYVERVDFRVKLNVTKQLAFCSHYAETHARSHHCFVLHGQQVDDYCAVATAQMILCYYRYYYTQDQIAPALNYSPGGGCPSDQSPGYESLTCNHLDASFDAAPAWEKARAEIDALHPFKSGISGHARACAGYAYTWWLFGGVTSKKLLIYDPWPWNADYALAGAVAWEDWNSITHTNYVTTKLRCP